MTTMRVLHLVNQSGNHYKFYRIYYFEGREICQWGAIGTDGRFQLHDHGSRYAASSKAQERKLEKLGRGYTLEQDLNVEVDIARFEQRLRLDIRNAGVYLADLYRQEVWKRDREVKATPVTATPNARPAFTPPDPKPATPKDRVQDLTERVLQVLQAAATNPQGAFENYALLRAEADQLIGEVEALRHHVNTLEQVVLASLT